MGRVKFQTDADSAVARTDKKRIGPSDSAQQRNSQCRTVTKFCIVINIRDIINNSNFAVDRLRVLAWRVLAEGKKFSNFLSRHPSRTLSH